MPDETTPPTVDDSTPLPEVRGAYNRASARVAELEGQVAGAEQAARENVFLRAGVDLDSPLGKLLFDGYKGEMTKEAVVAAWAGIQPAEATPPPAEEGQPNEAIERQERHEALVNGSIAPGTEPDPHPMEEAYRIFHAGMKKGRSREKASRPALEHIVAAAANGDERVIFDPVRWREEMAAR